MGEEISYGEFAAHEGEPFEVELGPGETATLVLASTTILGGGTNPARQAAERQADSFSLEFRGPRSRLLPQATYQFKHAILGAFPLFIVPVGVEGDQYRYEALFNRLPRAPESTP